MTAKTGPGALGEAVAEKKAIFIKICLKQTKNETEKLMLLHN